MDEVKWPSCVCAYDDEAKFTENTEEQQSRRGRGFRSDVRKNVPRWTGACGAEPKDGRRLVALSPEGAPKPWLELQSTWQHLRVPLTRHRATRRRRCQRPPALPFGSRWRGSYLAPLDSGLLRTRDSALQGRSCERRYTLRVSPPCSPCSLPRHLTQ